MEGFWLSTADGKKKRGRPFEAVVGFFFVCVLLCLELFWRRYGVPMLGKRTEIGRVLAQYLHLTLKNKFKSKNKYICKRKVILE